MQDPQTLKLCPFCGGSACTFTDMGDYFVECSLCSNRTSLRDSKPEAIEAWNERVAATEIEHLQSQLNAATEALAAVEPYLDAIVCYASTMNEHEPNRIAFNVRAALKTVGSMG